MILSCRQRRIQPIRIEGTMTMSSRQRIQLKRKKWYYQIKDPSGKVMSNHLGQRWPGECFQPFQENFSAGSYSRTARVLGLTLWNNKVESANHQTLLMKGPVSDKTPRTEWQSVSQLQSDESSQERIQTKKHAQTPCKDTVYSFWAVAGPCTVLSLLAG